MIATSSGFPVARSRRSWHPSGFPVARFRFSAYWTVSVQQLHPRRDDRFSLELDGAPKSSETTSGFCASSFSSRLSSSGPLPKPPWDPPVPHLGRSSLSSFWRKPCCSVGGIIVLAQTLLVRRHHSCWHKPRWSVGGITRTQSVSGWLVVGSRMRSEVLAPTFRWDPKQRKKYKSKRNIQPCWEMDRKRAPRKQSFGGLVHQRSEDIECLCIGPLLSPQGLECFGAGTPRIRRQRVLEGLALFEASRGS